MLQITRSSDLSCMRGVIDKKSFHYMSQDCLPFHVALYSRIVAYSNVPLASFVEFIIYNVPLMLTVNCRYKYVAIAEETLIMKYLEIMLN